MSAAYDPSAYAAAPAAQQHQPQPQQQSAVDWSALEANDGVRMSWNVVANSRAEMAKCVVPFGAV